MPADGCFIKAESAEKSSSSLPKSSVSISYEMRAADECWPIQEEAFGLSGLLAFYYLYWRRINATLLIYKALRAVKGDCCYWRDTIHFLRSYRWSDSIRFRKHRKHTTQNVIIDTIAKATDHISWKIWWKFKNWFKSSSFQLLISKTNWIWVKIFLCLLHLNLHFIVIFAAVKVLFSF